MSEHDSNGSDSDLTTSWLLSQLPMLCITTASILVERMLRRDSIRDRCYAQIWLWLATTVSLSLPSLASDTGDDAHGGSHMIQQRHRRIQAGWSSLLFFSTLLHIFDAARKQQSLLFRIRQRRRRQQQIQRLSMMQKIAIVVGESAMKYYRIALPCIPIAAWTAHGVTAVSVEGGVESAYMFAVTWFALMGYRFYHRRQRPLERDGVFRAGVASGAPLGSRAATTTHTTTSTSESQSQPSPASASTSNVPILGAASSVSPSASGSLPLSSPHSTSSSFFGQAADDSPRWYAWSPSRVLQWFSDVLSEPENVVDNFGRTYISNDDDIYEDDDDYYGDFWIVGGSRRDNDNLGEEVLSILAPQRLSGRILDTLTASRLHQEIGVPYGPACRLADAIGDLVMRYPKPRAMGLTSRREPFTTSRLQVNSSSSGAADEDDYDDIRRDNFLAQYDAQYNQGAIRRSAYNLKPAPPGSDPLMPEPPPQMHQRMQQMMHDRYGLPLPQPKNLPPIVSSSSTSDGSPNPASSSGSSHPLSPPAPRTPLRPTMVPIPPDSDAKPSAIGRPPPIEGAHARDALLSLRQRAREGTSGDPGARAPYTDIPPVSTAPQSAPDLLQTPNPPVGVENPLSDLPQSVLAQMPPHIREIAYRNPTLVRQMLAGRASTVTPPRMGSVAEHKEVRDDSDEEDDSDDDETTNLLGKSPPDTPPRYRSIG